MEDNLSGEDNEVELLTRLGKGDKSAFELLYNQYKYRITGNLLKLLKSEDLAEEILQDLFVKIWDTRKTIDPQKSFRSYLFRIAENMVIDYYRKVSRDKRIQDKLMTAATESYSHIEEHIFSKESELLLYGAIELLPPQRKQVFTLCKLEGKSYKEVSKLLGISHSTINDHLLKSNRFLKQHLKPQSGAVLSGVVTAILFGI